MKRSQFWDHTILVLGALFMLVPVVYALMTSSMMRCPFTSMVYS